MPNTAVTQNMSVLDNLLQDLSNAKLNGFNGSLNGSLSPTGSLDCGSPMIHSRSVEERHETREETYFVDSKMIEQESKWEFRIGNGTPKKSPPGQQISTMSTVSKRSDFSFSAASTSSHDIDNLMMSLNAFRLRDGGVPATEIPVNTSIDQMLCNLQETLEKEGIKTGPRGICAECDKPIIGNVISAIGKTFHPEHFVCAQCNQELGSENFFERDGKPYCERDYQSLFSPQCAACQGAILDRCITALDQTWHPEHFVCADCKQSFGDDGFHERDSFAFCNQCYFSSFAPKCAGCSLPITENYISSMNCEWHSDCFVCVMCRQPFVDGNYFEHEGQPYCEAHFHTMRGSLCAGCDQLITGRCVTAMFRKFHPEHFVCSFCLKQLNKGTFKEHSEKPFCHECFDRLFG